MTEKFCLRWNDFEANIKTAFQDLRDGRDFFDVTLACDQDQIQAHKVILSACSPFFHAVLKRNPHQHPLLYLKGVQYQELVSILNFMYHGEVNIAQEELNSFLNVAEELKIKGLTQTNETATARKEERESEAKKTDLPKPTKKQRLSLTYSRNHDEGESSQETLQSVKAEPQTTEIVCDEDQNFSDRTALAETDYAEHYDGSYEEHFNQEFNDSSSVDLATDNKGGCSQYMSQVGEGNRFWQCHFCSKMYVSKPSMEDHIKGTHLGTQSSYPCEYCGKHFQSRNSRSGHISKHHKLLI